MASDRSISIGGAAGAWGDTSFATPQLLASRRCHYIMYEALAEITMGILTRARLKDPALGYATDIIELIGRHLAEFRAQNLRVITNAGGVNPSAAAARLRDIAASRGIELRVASIDGDDLSHRTGEFSELLDIDDGVPLPARVASFSAYLGARPIAAALDAGADIVVSGRCVDSALALGPLIHEFGWGFDQFDQLSGGSLAGHLLECGPQSTGGLLTDWRDVDDWENIGYPIAECHADGSFVLTKPEGSAGLVDRRTVAEQLLYEIGDPAAYLLPDVSCDWRNVELSEIGVDRVHVSGARGNPPPATLKACAQTVDGYKLQALFFIGGRDAVERAKRFAIEASRRIDRVLARDQQPPLRALDLEILGSESTYGPHSRARNAREVIVKLGLHHDQRSVLSTLVRELPSFAMAIAGLSGGGTGLARPTPLIRLHSYLVPRELIQARVELDGAAIEFADVPLEWATAAPNRNGVETTVNSAGAPPAGVTSGTSELGSLGFDPGADAVEVPLIAIAHARSGDKGRHANIGVRARHPDFLPCLRAQLTADAVARYFAHRIAGSVTRYELGGIDAFNFLLADALGGGGIASLRFDPQGKAYAQQLLDFPISIPPAWLHHPKLAEIPELQAVRSSI